MYLDLFVKARICIDWSECVNIWIYAFAWYKMGGYRTLYCKGCYVIVRISQ